MASSSATLETSKLRPRERAQRTLRQWIEEGVLPPGEPLPPEQVLAERLQINRGTLRSALAQLQENGFIAGEKQRRFPVIPNRPQSKFEHIVAHVTAQFQESARPEEYSAGRYLFSSLTQALEKAGLHQLLLPANESVVNKANWIKEAGLQGLLVGEIYDAIENVAPLVEQLREDQVPVTVYGNWPEFQNCDRVDSDQEAGSYLITRWLIERGRTRILPVWHSPGATGFWFHSRQSGYERAMKEAHLTALPPLIVETMPGYDWSGIHTRSEFEQVARYTAGHLLEHMSGPDKPDAICAATDWLVPRLAAACRLFKLEPNVDIDLVGYDNIWAGLPERAWETTRPLATVDKNNEALGAELVQLFLDRAAGRLPVAPQLRVTRPQLVVVDS